MSTTVRSIIEQALGLSLRNRREAVAEEANELLLVVQRTMMQAYSDAATLYPEYFGIRESVAYSALVTGWPRPSRAISIFRIEKPSGDEVVVVTDRDRFAERFQASVIERGRVFYPGTTTASPTSETLEFFYAPSPVVLAVGNIDQNIDSSFPDAFTPLLVFAVAVYLAQKDQRETEIPALAAQLSAWGSLWQRHLIEGSQNTRYRFAPRGPITPETSVTSNAPT